MQREHLNINSGVYLFGAGQTGQHLANILISKGIKVHAFIDEVQAALHSSILDIPVLLPSNNTINKQFNTFVTIFNPKHEYLESERRLKENYGFQKVYPAIVLMYMFHEECLPFYFFGQQKDVENKMNDYSIFRNILTDSLSEYFLDRYLEMISNGRFFLNPLKGHNPFLLIKEKVVSTNNLLFVDCGAFDGDTVSAFHDMFPNENLQIHAFEPDEMNYRKLLSNHSLSKFDKRSAFNNLAVWSLDTSLAFSAQNSQGSCIDPRSNSYISAVSLDSYFQTKDLDIHRQNLIVKLDVEGAELEALNGAKKIIGQGAILAISVYHRPHDILEVYNYLNSFDLEYKYFLRGFGGDCADLLLYAIPSEKLIQSD